MTHVIADLPTDRYEELQPDAEGMTDVLGRIGHSLADALADLIDNSLDAGSKHVLIRFTRGKDRLVRVTVADDGTGMSEKRLKEIMQFGVKTNHASSDLGKYGIGLKAASFSWCDSFSVITHRDNKTAGRRWTRESVKMGWRVEVIASGAATSFYSRGWKPIANNRHGTLIVWDRVRADAMRENSFEAHIDKLLVELGVDLGMRFHRFIQDGRLKIFLQTELDGAKIPNPPIPVAPYNPFGYPAPGRKGYPVDFQLSLENGHLIKLRAHIWPPNSKHQNYKLGGGAVVKRQGFYFYRNDRLIEPGGWHGYQMEEPHSSLARVEVELPPSLDSAFQLTVQKHAFQPPQSFLDAVKAARAGNTSFMEYVEAAKDTYRNAPKDGRRVFVPGKGLPVMASKGIGKLFPKTDREIRSKVDFVWARMPADTVFSLDRDDATLVLNARYRDEITGGKSSATDAALVKTLLFFISREALGSLRISGKLRDDLQFVNDAMLQALGHGK